MHWDEVMQGHRDSQVDEETTTAITQVAKHHTVYPIVEAAK